MTLTEIFEICGGKDNWQRLYSLCDDSIANFLDSAKLDHSEKSFEILKTIFSEVIDDVGESWYRRSLGK